MIHQFVDAINRVPTPIQGIYQPLRIQPNRSYTTLVVRISGKTFHPKVQPLVYWHSCFVRLLYYFGALQLWCSSKLIASIKEVNVSDKWTDEGYNFPGILFTEASHDAAPSPGDDEKKMPTDYSDFFYFFKICVNLCNLWAYFHSRAKESGWPKLDQPELSSQSKTSVVKFARICACLLRW